MSANIDSSLANWSTTDASNQPDGTDTADIDAEFRRIQAVIRKHLRTIGANIASASTVDLSAATGDVVNITGTTTITSLGTVSAGMRVWIVFGGALTLTHNATSLILPGGANITTAAGDVACFESLGSGNWRCFVYQRAGNVYAASGANTDITSLAGLTTPLSVAQGGTAQTTIAAAVQAYLDEISTTQGTVLYRNANDWVALAPGTAGQVLATGGAGANPSWAAGSTTFDSTVRVHTANGFGSTNTKIRRFTTVVQNAGSDITYADSAANGASFTVNTTGMYGISYTENGSSAFNSGISVNSAELTSDVADINANNRLVSMYNSASSTGATSCSVYLTAGDVIRPHSTGVGAAVNARTNFIISRIG